MIAYYLGLAVRGLRRNTMLTALIVMALGSGVGAAMTVLTVFRAMAADPIPGFSHQLYVPQIDNWGPDAPPTESPDRLPNQLSYRDATALLAARGAVRQAAMYSTGLVITPPNPQLLSFRARARASSADFFPMFRVPFKYGGPWSRADDESHATVAVITTELNARLFGGGNSVGRTITVGQGAFRVVGVLDKWTPVPRFFDLNSDRYGGVEDVLLPFTTAIDQQLPTLGNEDCTGDVPAAWDLHIHSECVWIQFWAELPAAADVTHFKQLLRNYAAEQQRDGRFRWLPATQLLDTVQWLEHEHVVPASVRILVVLSFTFLLVCLLNAVGLMLAKFIANSPEIRVRRALGASRGAIFTQFVIEAGMIGFAGSVLGLLLTWLGLAGIRSLFTREIANLTQLDIMDVGLLVLLAIGVAVAAGVYPAWRATQMRATWHLKV